MQILRQILSWLVRPIRVPVWLQVALISAFLIAAIETLLSSPFLAITLLITGALISAWSLTQAKRFHPQVVEQEDKDVAAAAANPNATSAQVLKARRWPRFQVIIGTGCMVTMLIETIVGFLF